MRISCATVVTALEAIMECIANHLEHPDRFAPDAEPTSDELQAAHDELWAAVQARKPRKDDAR